MAVCRRAQDAGCLGRDSACDFGTSGGAVWGSSPDGRHAAARFAAACADQGHGGTGVRARRGTPWIRRNRKALGVAGLVAAFRSLWYCWSSTPFQSRSPGPVTTTTVTTPPMTFMTPSTTTASPAEGLAPLPAHRPGKGEGAGMVAEKSFLSLRPGLGGVAMSDGGRLLWDFVRRAGPVPAWCPH